MDQPILTTTILLQVHTNFHNYMEVNAVCVARILQTPVSNIPIMPQLCSQKGENYITNYAILSFFWLDPELIVNHDHILYSLGIFVSCSSHHKLTT